MILPFIFREKFFEYRKKELFVAWFFLIAAIVFEVLGTSFLKMENQILGYIFMALFIAFSYFFMGKAIKKKFK